MVGTPEYPELKSDKGKALAMLLIPGGFPEHRIAFLWDYGDDRVAKLIGSSVKGKTTKSRRRPVSLAAAPEPGSIVIPSTP
jgi:hypothetical protein